MKIYILTSEFNDYDQHGEYFIQAFLAKPTGQDLKELGIPQDRIEHVLKGGGRIQAEYKWYFLNELEIK